MFIYLIEQIWSRYDVTFDLLIQQMFKGKTKNFDIAWLRGLVRTGATGASTPAEIRQRVRRTRPQDVRMPFGG